MVLPLTVRCSVCYFPFLPLLQSPIDNQKEGPKEGPKCSKEVNLLVGFLASYVFRALAGSVEARNAVAIPKKRWQKGIALMDTSMTTKSAKMFIYLDTEGKY